MKLAIRPIKKKEVKEFARLIKKSLLDDFPDYSARIKKFLLKGELSPKLLLRKFPKRRFAMWGAFVDGKMVGYLEAGLPYGGIIFVMWVGVKRGFQGKGIGRKLLGKFARWSARQGVHALHLYTAKDTMPFYKKLGFEDIGLVKKGYFGVNDHFMIKILQEPKEENFLTEKK